MPVKTTIVPRSIWKTLAYLHMFIFQLLNQLVCTLISAMLAGLKSNCLALQVKGIAAFNTQYCKQKIQHNLFTEG